VFAHLNNSEFLQIDHRTRPMVFLHDILETYVKVFDNRPRSSRGGSEWLMSTVRFGARASAFIDSESC